MTKFDFGEFLDVASKLAADDKSTEPEFRTAVGRAFYAVWEQVETLYRNLDGPKDVLNKAGYYVKPDRKYIAQWLNIQENLDVKRCGLLFLGLNLWRVGADYDNFPVGFEFNYDCMMAIQAIKSAKEIKKALKMAANG